MPAIPNSPQPLQPPQAPRPLTGWSLDDRNPAAIARWMPVLEWFYRHYFRVTTEGWEWVPPAGKMLVVGSHNGGIASPDMYMFGYDWFQRFGPERPLYGLMHPKAWQAYPIISAEVARFGALQAHPKMAIAALRANAAVGVYPGGAQDLFRPHSQRDRIHFAGRKGFIKLALREEAPILPVMSVGAHDTLFVVGDCYEQMQQLHQWGLPWLFDLDPEVFPIYLGLPWIVGIGPLPNFPLPVRIHTRVCPPIVFERYGRAAACDRNYVEACYQQVVTQMQQNLDEIIAAYDSNRPAKNTTG